MSRRPPRARSFSGPTPGSLLGSAHTRWCRLRHFTSLASFSEASDFFAAPFYVRHPYLNRREPDTDGVGEKTKWNVAECANIHTHTYTRHIHTARPDSANGSAPGRRRGCVFTVRQIIAASQVLLVINAALRLRAPSRGRARGGEGGRGYDHR